MIRTTISALHSSRLCFLNGLLKRMCSNSSEVRVISTTQDNSVKISFRYWNLPPSRNMISFKALKDQQISEVLSQIKIIVNLHRKKETIRLVAASKYSNSLAGVQLFNDEDVQVNLLHRDGLIKNDVKNADAWSQASILKVGDLTYEVNYNMPTVAELTLPNCILAGCIIRPHFILECAAPEDSIFSWYRSTGLKNSAEKEPESNSDWQKVSEGILYTTSNEDIGHKLKVVCVPKRGDVIGSPSSIETNNVVEAGPALFPFEERQMHTKDLVDSDCIRCVSYNILANCYVEPRRFPYTSRRALDIYYRKQLLMREILGYNSDIICLQEVQDRVFIHDLYPIMKKAGFEAFFVRKGGKRYEGICAFYRKRKFNVLGEYGVYLNKIVNDKDMLNQVVKKVYGNFKDMGTLLAQETALLVIFLEHVDNPSHKVIVANTHLYSNKDKPEVRLLQSALCSLYLERFLNNMKSEHGENIGLIFCGDFNSLPNSASYDFLLNGSHTCIPGKQNNSSSEDQNTTLSHNLAIKSACGAPSYTNYTEEFYGCLDYIFYRDQEFSVSEVVPMPKHEDVIRYTALPSELFPSDHIPLVCTLKWRKWHDKC